MVSPIVNVTRYTALAAGIFYGFYHRRTLQAAHDAHKLEQAAHHREHLIAEAKEAWKRKQEQASGKDDVITDPEDPRFDLEKLIAKWEKAA
ncbi:F1F0 ATP synthase subunit e, mitochondrial [Stygiomarasmius scandens]|uniref:ATP synthase F(0) complex subunit e, mitochondrial n=1 Tax=Marasmiellus scandens TaxID=2682957 RepID=A0ABR1JVE9_9AGAR